MNKPPTNFRWIILSLLFVATTILYIDRSALGILAPELQKSIGWSEDKTQRISNHKHAVDDAVLLFRKALAGRKSNTASSTACL
jgi:hypothetical protein